MPTCMHACMHTNVYTYIIHIGIHIYTYIHMSVFCKFPQTRPVALCEYSRSNGACTGICICRIGRIKADVDAMEMVDADNLKKNAADKGCKATAVALVKLAGAMQSGNLAAVVRPCAATPPSAPPTIPEPPSTSFFKREKERGSETERTYDDDAFSGIQ